MPGRAPTPPSGGGRAPRTPVVPAADSQVALGNCAGRRAYQPSVPGAPLNGPVTRDVIQPP